MSCPGDAAYQDRISAAVADITDKRARIEQVKRMLALLYGLADDDTFELLKHISQLSNTKLRTVADQIYVQFRELSGPRLPERMVYEQILVRLTQNPALAHRRDDSEETPQVVMMKSRG